MAGAGADRMVACHPGLGEMGDAVRRTSDPASRVARRRTSTVACEGLDTQGAGRSEALRLPVDGPIDVAALAKNSAPSGIASERREEIIFITRY
jgi:hypothetical protein